LELTGSWYSPARIFKQWWIIGTHKSREYLKTSSFSRRTLTPQQELIEYWIRLKIQSAVITPTDVLASSVYERKEGT
jgi:hypothetical protein